MNSVCQNQSGNRKRHHHLDIIIQVRFNYKSYFIFFLFIFLSLSRYLYTLLFFVTLIVYISEIIPLCPSHISIKHSVIITSQHCLESHVSGKMKDLSIN